MARWIILTRPTGAGERNPDAPRHSNIFSFVWSVSARQQVIIILLAVVVAALDVLPLELQRRMVDGAISEGSLSQLLVLSAIYAAVLIAHAVIKHGLRVYRGAVSEDVLQASRARLYTISHRASATDDGSEAEPDDGEDGEEADGANGPQSEREATRVAVLGHEVEEIAVFAGSAFSDAVIFGATIIGLMGYMIFTEPLLAAVSLPFLLPQVFAVPWIQTYINRLSERRVEGRRTLNATVMDEATDDFMATGKSLRSLGVDIAWLKSLVRFLVNGLNALAPLVVLAFGGALVIAGETTLGVIVAFVSGFQRLADPIRDLIDYYRNASLTQARYRMVGRWLCKVPTP